MSGMRTGKVVLAIIWFLRGLYLFPDLNIGKFTDTGIVRYAGWPSEVSVSLVCDYDFFFNLGPDKFCMTQLDFCWFQNLIPGKSLFSRLYCGVCVCVCVHMHTCYDSSSIVILYSHTIHFPMSLFGQLLECDLDLPPCQLFVEEWGPRREIYSGYLIACYTLDCWRRSNCPKNSRAPDTGQRDVWNGVPKINVT